MPIYKKRKLKQVGAKAPQNIKNIKNKERKKKTMKKATIYINGIKASKGDLKALLEWLKQGKTEATAHTTKSGNLAITTTF